MSSSGTSCGKPRDAESRGGGGPGPQRGGGGSSLCAEVIEWLQKKRIDVPAALRRHGGPTDAAGVLALLPGLRERERRALGRFIEQRDKRRSEAAAPAQAPVLSSDDEDPSAALGPPPVAGGTWPDGVVYSNNYKWGSDVPTAERLAQQPAGSRSRSGRPCKRVCVRVIADKEHPACGERGLFAARDLPHGTRVVDYVGAVCLGPNEDRSSDYVCDFGEHSQFALDANTYGNEARFINDYRNTGRRATVEFRLRRDKCGELRQGVFVCDKAGVRAGDELLISYGKGFWKSRVGSDLDEFITRRPGE